MAIDDTGSQAILSIFRIRYSSMPPPNHKLPLDLDLNGIVDELTVGKKGYVIIPSVFTKEEVEMARFELFDILLCITCLHFLFSKSIGKPLFT